jgi:trehalose-phosphatase
MGVVNIQGVRPISSGRLAEKQLINQEKKRSKPLFLDWKEIEDQILDASSLFLFLDYDGTLTPIVSTPDLALCPAGVKTVLERLRDIPNVFLAVISGRSLGDIESKVGVPGIIYVGNHGLDIQNPAGIHIKKLSPSRQEEFSQIGQRLEAALAPVSGILFENKGSILAVHYRNVEPEKIGWIQGILRETVGKWKSRWELLQGKMVMEIRPRLDFNKGKAVQEILKRSPRDILPIYLGDDQTDEYAFRAIKGKGISVFVGSSESPSEAEYFLANPAEVETFLWRCEKIMAERTNGMGTG